MPLALVMTTRSAPVSRFWTVTVTPGSTAPELSMMTPSIAPLAACDCADAGTAMRDRSSRNTERRDTESLLEAGAAGRGDEARRGRDRVRPDLMVCASTSGLSLSYLERMSEGGARL